MAVKEPIALLFAPRTNDHGRAQKKKKFGPKKKPNEERISVKAVSNGGKNVMISAGAAGLNLPPPLQ